MNLNLSPSIGHRHLIDSTPMQLAYVGGDVPAWQKKVRRKLRELLAVPENPGTPPRVRRLWRREIELGVIEKIAFTAEPGVDVPGYWCVPRGAKPPYFTFICLQGHSTGMHNSIAVDREMEQSPHDVEGDRDFALGCMKRGIAALCIEQRSFGTRRELTQQHISGHDGCLEAVARALLIGRTLVGERVFDVERSIDYLESRGDIDMARLGILGNSSGGTTSMYAAALLPKIRAAIPSCSTARFADSIAAIHHCSCNAVPGILQWLDMGDILGAIAPRPLVIVNGKADDIFPLASAKQAVKQAQRIYTAASAANQIQFVIGPEGHRFYADLAWKAMLSLPRMGKAKGGENLW
jgi:dienelactone hydrolase